MKHNIQCPDCGKQFAPTDEDWQIIQDLAKSNASLAMITCTECWETIDCDPTAVVPGGGSTRRTLSSSGQQMRPKIPCEMCKKLFTPDDEGWNLIQRQAARGAPGAAIDCTQCWHTTLCDVQGVLDGNPSILEPEQGETLRCPTVGCIGWVCEVEESPGKTFWGCGECGKVWRKLAALDTAITKIIKKHPYREGCYVSSKSGWMAADEDLEHPDYEELVEAES